MLMRNKVLYIYQSAKGHSVISTALGFQQIIHNWKKHVASLCHLLSSVKLITFPKTNIIPIVKHSGGSVML